MLNQKLCKKCKTGRITYENDPNSPVCPYLSTYMRKSCPHFLREKGRIYTKMTALIKRLCIR